MRPALSRTGLELDRFLLFSRIVLPLNTAEADSDYSNRDPGDTTAVALSPEREAHQEGFRITVQIEIHWPTGVQIQGYAVCVAGQNRSWKTVLLRLTEQRLVDENLDTLTSPNHQAAEHFPASLGRGRSVNHRATL